MTQASSEGGWTVETLRVYLLDKITGNDARYSQQFQSQDNAVKAALNAQLDARKEAALVSEKRLEGLNELRKMAEDQQKVHAEYTKTYMPRAEAMAEIRAATEKVEAANKRVDALTSRLDTVAGEKHGSRETKDDSKWMITTVVAVAVAAASLLGSLFVRPTPAPVAAQPSVVYIPAPAGSLLPTTPPQPAPR